MKKAFVLIALISLPAIAVAAFDPSQAFDEVKLELPTISLTALKQQDPLTILSDKGISFQRPAPARSAKRHVVSNMPVITPKDGVDSKMPIKAPDASVDYKLMVKTPGVEPAK